MNIPFIAGSTKPSVGQVPAAHAAHKAGSVLATMLSISLLGDSEGKAMISREVRRLAAAIVASVLALAPLAWTAPAAAEVDFTGKVITLIVPFNTGGGTDRWARFWASLVSSELPGNPEIRIKNVTGGGSTKGANEFHETATDDGMLLFASSASVVFPFLLGDRRVKYSLNDWKPLLASSTGGVVYADPEVVDSEQDPARIKPGKKLNFLVQGPTQLGVLMLLSLDMLGYEYTANFGASGSSAIFRNFRDGGANIDMQTTASYKVNVTRLVEKGSAYPLFSFGVSSPTGEIRRDPNFPGIPHFQEYLEKVRGEKPKGQIDDAWNQLFYAAFPAQKILFLPKNTKPEVLETYFAAIARVLEKEHEWPNSKRDLLGEYELYSGQEAETLVEQLQIMSLSVVDWYRGFIKEVSGISI